MTYPTYGLTIEQITDRAHKTAREKGWWDHPQEIPALLALVHSEVSEALEDYRVHGISPPIDGMGDIARGVRFEGPDRKPEGIGTELADVIIRICDLSEFYGIDLETAIREKLAYNETRPYKHGGKKL